ncbi:MAG TPA: hypothetical protein VMV46_09705 [Thermoanaerobaculia bacterium]|nr:hypothetical protein [Thermoanaerobaculia bacterium]
MYTFRLKKSGPLSAMALADQGRIVSTPQGDRLVVRSLAVAQRLAKLFAGYGLLA